MVEQLAKGLPVDEVELQRWPMAKRINRLSRVVVSMTWDVRVQTFNDDGTNSSYSNTIQVNVG